VDAARLADLGDRLLIVRTAGARIEAPGSAAASSVGDWGFEAGLQHPGAPPRTLAVPLPFCQGRARPPKLRHDGVSQEGTR
jgi:hypothetical protein